MDELIHDRVVKEVIQELVEGASKKQPFHEYLIDNYLQGLQARAELYIKSGGDEEDLQEYLRGHYEKVLEAFTTSPEFIDSLYKKSYTRLRSLNDGSKTYGDLFTEIYEDETYLNEIFVRLVEEGEGVAITSAKQLQELTGITDTGGGQEKALEELESAFTQAMSYRYSKALVGILEAGGKYSDLIEVRPSFYNLPETWSGCLQTDQYSSILWAIEEVFLVGNNFTAKPGLKAIAKEIEAPYSVLMDTNQVCSDPNYYRERKRVRAIGMIKARLPEVINKQSKQWKEERGLLGPNKGAYKLFERGVISATEGLALQRLGGALGQPQPITFTKELMDFVTKHFTHEIQAMAGMLIDEGLGGSKLAREIKAEVKNGTTGN